VRVTLESTTKIVKFVTLTGTEVDARIWEGQTESGIAVHAFITRIAIDKTDLAANQQFSRELEEQRPPSPVIDAAYPLRMIL